MTKLFFLIISSVNTLTLCEILMPESARASTAFFETGFPSFAKIHAEETFMSLSSLLLIIFFATASAIGERQVFPVQTNKIFFI